MRFTVDPWDPSYGASVETELGPSDLVPHPDVERPRDEWAPVDPPAGVAPPEAVLFVDGVRRTDAQVWVEGAGPEDGGAPSPALCASYAAGVVCCCADGAHLVSARVERGLFGTHPDGTDVVTWAGTYGFEHTTGQRGTAPAQVLSQGVQTKLAALELSVAIEAREHTRGPDLVVVDGQLRGAVGPPGAGPLPRTLGFVKTHSRTYLPPDLNPVVAALAAGQRTPVFRLAPAGEDDPLLTRFTWYLRLPCPPGSPWAGVARVECSGQVPVAEAVALADTSQVTLVRFASTAYKDSRAPQNLFPIAGLERALRRRLGEPALLYRALRSAAQAGGSAQRRTGSVVPLSTVQA